MGHIAHLRKQLKSINTWFYHNVDWERKTHYLHFENGMFLHLNQLESPSPKYVLRKDWLKLTQWYWTLIERGFLNFVNIFSLFCNYLPLKKGLSLHLNKFESPSPKNALCKVWLKLERWFWRRFFKFHQCIFAISLLSPPGKWCGPPFEPI